MKAKVLVVDDETMVREMLMSALSKEGYACSGAASAKEASRLLDEEIFDLALLDIFMAGESGIQALYELKQQSPDTEVIMVTSNTNVETAMFCIRLGAYDYITKPFNFEQIMCSMHNALEKRHRVFGNHACRIQLEKQVSKQTDQIRATLSNSALSPVHTLSALARAMDAREKETGGHSERVCDYALLLAKTLGMREPELSDLVKAALLHDLGKISVPDSILLKPGKLNVEEWAEIRKHPRIGHDIVASVPFLEKAAGIILTHHERYDGTGYPLGLKGKEIPIGARIFAVVDTLDAMTSDRPYRKALPFEAVVKEMSRCSGTQFDPEIVRTFLSIPRLRWEKIARKSLLSGHPGARVQPGGNASRKKVMNGKPTPPDRGGRPSAE